jgi:hypothetical protein
MRLIGVTVGSLLLACLLGGVRADALDDTTWDQKIDNALARFKVLAAFNDEAVLDRETGLVWERDPAAGTETETGVDSWSIAAIKCIRKAVGGRKGWRLASVHELASLVDVAVPPDNIRLPPRHPFLNIGTDFYWTATTWAEDASRAWVVRFLGGGVVTDSKPNAHPFWCVRGGSPGPDAY